MKMPVPHVRQTKTSLGHSIPLGSGAIHLLPKAEYDALVNEIRSLRAIVDELQNQNNSAAYEITEMSDHDAKIAIAQYFKDHDGDAIYPSDVAAALKLDYQQTKSAMDDLVKEGAIAPA
ncbi:MAG TPA: hypothetical protein VIE65_00040 [Methylobacter sp.]|jgi:hypothetical protein